MGLAVIDVKSEWVSLEQYYQFVDELPAREVSIYHRSQWLDVVATSFDAKVRAIHTVDKDGSSLAITPVMIKSKAGLQLVGSPLSGTYTEFAGPLFVNELSDLGVAAVMESMHELVSYGSHYIEWGAEGSAELQSIWGRSLQRWNYQYRASPTIQVDLSQGEDVVWTSFKGRARNMIRKAEKSGVVACTVAPTKEWVDEYYEMLRSTFDRQGQVVPHPISFYQGLIKLANQDEALFVAAKIDSKMIAGGIFLKDRKRMVYLSGTASAEGMKLAGTSTLQWYAMCEGIKSGVIDYDMGGLGIPSIDKFKRSFGGRETVHHNWAYRSRLFRLIEPAARWALSKGFASFGGK